MRIPWKLLPEDIINRYNLREKRHGDYVYMRIKRGMYGLKQAAVLAYKQLCKHLEANGYTPIDGSYCMFKHETRHTKFCLCVDDFGIKYFSKDDADHLLQTLKSKFKTTEDWQGKHFCGYTFDWNYKKGYVDVAMPGHVQAALIKLKYIINKYPEYAPFDFVPIIYGKKGSQQYSDNPDTSPYLNAEETKLVQSIVGTFLYYGRALDGTILPALNTIGTQQAKPTKQTMKRCQRLMDSVNTYSNAFLRFYASDMVLHIDTDAAYLVLPKARSRIAGYFYCANLPKKPPMNNDPILIECKGLRRAVCLQPKLKQQVFFITLKLRYPFEES